MARLPGLNFTVFKNGKPRPCHSMSRCSPPRHPSVLHFRLRHHLMPAFRSRLPGFGVPVWNSPPHSYSGRIQSGSGYCGLQISAGRDAFLALCTVFSFLSGEWEHLLFYVLASGSLHLDSCGSLLVPVRTVLYVELAGFVLIGWFPACISGPLRAGFLRIRDRLSPL